jgi:mycothiol synthase
VSPSEQAPEGFEVRAATVDDAPAIAGIINEVTLAEIGLPWTTAEHMRDELTSPGRHPALADIVLAQDGSPIGYLQFVTDVGTASPVLAFPYVRPHLGGRGLNAFLLRLAEKRLRARAQLDPEVLRVSRFADNEPAERLFSALGFGRVRTFWVMRIVLDSPPLAARVPDGIAIRTFEPGRDEVPVHAALAEAFADHWGIPFSSFEEWLHLQVEGEGSAFDPNLWFVATEGDEVVGAACCRASSPRSEDTAIVMELAVRRAWRRRGVALALLHSAFAEFHRRGIPRAELSVDAESHTGATRLYERAGMRVAFSWETWEKELLRPQEDA